MDLYLQQLIEDFNKIIEERKKYLNSLNVNIDDELEEGENFVTDEEHTLSEITGIEKKLIPPASKLNGKQLSLLLNQIQNLLISFNFILDFPKGLPKKVKYSKLLEIWDEKRFVLINAGEYHIEFCNYDEENCPFPKYCDICSTFNNISNNSKEESLIKKELDFTENTPQERDYIEKRKEEIKTKIKNFDSTDKIEGIFNYCDRWCERCDFTSKCSSFKLDGQIGSDSKTDITNREFWLDIQALIESSIDLLKEMATENNIEIEEQSNLPIFKDNFKDNPLYVASVYYSKKVSEWLEKNNMEITDENIFLTHNNSDKIFNIDDALAILIWYSNFISSKIFRALTTLGKIEDEYAKKDMNGSAKVALIAIDRSIAAFYFLNKEISSYEDEILQFLLMLSKLKSQVETTFPNARKFIRPGFDE